MSIPAGGVTLQMDSEDRGTGEAYVEFLKPEDAEKALYKNRQMMGHRCICTCMCVYIRTIVCVPTLAIYGHNETRIRREIVPSCWPLRVLLVS